MKHYSFLIDGQDTEAISGERIEMLNPSTGKAFATIPRGNASDIDKAVASAKRALVGPWAQTSPVDRGRFLARLSRAIIERREELAQLESLELGGKSPHIVFADADLDKALPTIVSGLAVNAGQSCVAGTRVLIESAAYDRVASGLGKLFRALRTGGQESESPDFGPLINAKQRKRVEEFINRAKRDGIELIAQGELDPSCSPNGNFVRACLFGPAPPTTCLHAKRSSAQRSRLSSCRTNNVRAGSRHHKHQDIQRFLFVFQCRGTSTATRKYRNMKARLRTHGGVATLAKAASLRCGLPWARSHHFHYVSLLPGCSTSHNNFTGDKACFLSNAKPF